MSVVPELEDLRLGEDTRVARRMKAPRKHGGELFLKGPVPMSWLSSAGRLPGRALHVGVVLWILAGIKRTGTVALGARHLRSLGVDRHATYRALRRLEKAGLVVVQRRAGCAPKVTLLGAKPQAIETAEATP